MSLTPIELRVEVRKLGKKFIAVTKREDGQEICTHDFLHDITQLVHQESLWLLEQTARDPDEAFETNTFVADTDTFDTASLVEYGQLLYEHLFGDGQELQTFLHQQDGPTRLMLA